MMTSKSIGFSRTVYLSWLDATAMCRTQTDDISQIRQELEPILEKFLTGKEARRKTIDVLLSIWHKSADVSPRLHKDALNLYQNAYMSSDYVWLHYGLTLIYYPLFRQVTSAIGQISRFEETVTRDVLKRRMASEFGHLGALDRYVERLSASLTEWDIMPATENRSVYRPVRRELFTDSIELQLWLLACALFAHPGESLPYTDFLRLPELFPFKFAVALEEFRSSSFFSVQREGMGWDMVRLVI